MNESHVILHVDDDRSCLELSRASFDRALPNVDLVTRDDADDALATLSVEAVDAIVSDSIELADGTPFVEAARNAYPDVPIVLYTGKEFVDVAPVLTSAGVTEYVQKGTDGPMSDLVSRVGRIVGTEASATNTDRFRYTSPADEASPTMHEAVPDEEWTELAQCDPTSMDELLVTLVDVIGDRAADQPLLELFDVEALARVFSSQNEDASLYFSVRLDTHEIVVTGDGTVASRPLTSG